MMRVPNKYLIYRYKSILLGMSQIGRQQSIELGARECARTLAPKR
jgi:hypothetical protein